VLVPQRGRPPPRTKNFRRNSPSAPAQAKLLGLVAMPLGSALPSGLIWAQKSSAAKGQRARAARTHTHVGPQSAGGSDHTPTCQKVI